jgi:hypothetical protein
VHGQQLLAIRFHHIHLQLLIDLLLPRHHSLIDGSAPQALDSKFGKAR